jgi:hypothetical protein
MKGNNVLKLNAATAMEAVQEYLDKRMGNFAPRVTAIESDGNSYQGYTLIVHVTDRTSEGKDAGQNRPTGSEEPGHG